MPTLVGTREQRSGDPAFTAMETSTAATDETGQSWMAMGLHDLSDLGFRNNSLNVRKFGEMLGIYKKPN